MNKKSQEFLNVTAREDNNCIVYDIVSAKAIDKSADLSRNSVFLTHHKKKIRVYVRRNITSNCQVGAMSLAYKLNILTPEECREFLLKITGAGVQYKNKIKWDHCFVKSTILLDIRKEKLSKIEYRFKKAGAKKVMRTSYKNANGSPMVMMIMNLRTIN